MYYHNEERCRERDADEVFFRKVCGSWWSRSAVEQFESVLGHPFNDHTVERVGRPDLSPGGIVCQVKSRFRSRSTGMIVKRTLWA